MKERIVNFIRLLRDSEVRISIAESIEACKALGICDITDRQIFKIALQTTLIKRSEDLPIFNKIFDLYFAEPVENIQEPEISEDEFKSLLEQIKEQMKDDAFDDLEEESQNGSKDGKQNNQQMPSEFNSNAQKFDKEQQSKDLFKQGSESELKQKAQDMANSRKFEEWESENIDCCCDRIMQENKIQYCKTMAKNETRRSKQCEIEEKYEKLKQMLKEEIEKAMVRQFGESIIQDIVENNNIMDKDLSELTLEELQKIQEIIKKIAKKLATHVSRKEKRAKNGKISIRKTIRSSIQYGNTSSELRFKNKKKTKSELVVLCDISGSVWMYVSFMLQLVVGIQTVFDRVESYIFIDRIRNITEKVINSTNIKQTVESFLHDYSLGSGTDYGNVFKLFSEEKDLFNKKTVLIIMGDAENTGKTTGEEFLKEVSEKCKVVYWLHPKDKQQWINHYCRLDVYGKHCKEVYQCSTLRELEEFVKKLIKI
jgi:uncharacterized protein with von Willebrand factor type A (vWA) domain